MFGIVATGSGFSGCSFLLCAPPFLQSKNPLFARQKGGFCVSKVWFLKCKKGVFVFRMHNNHEINKLCTVCDDVLHIL